MKGYAVKQIERNIEAVSTPCCTTRKWKNARMLLCLVWEVNNCECTSLQSSALVSSQSFIPGVARVLLPLTERRHDATAAARDDG